MRTEANYDALRLAVHLAGGQSSLAAICKCSRSNINRQLRLKAGLPARYVNIVEEKLKIPRHILRGDLYPLEREP